jgi:hypothetical protein
MVILAVAILGCGVQLSAQEQSPVLLYYADAYADHYHVPRALFRAIVSQESNWNPLALSDKGAMGLMQLMPATAREYDISNPEEAAKPPATVSRSVSLALFKAYGESPSRCGTGARQVIVESQQLIGLEPVCSLRH